MTIGLDLGGYQFRSMRAMADRLVARSCPAVFTAVSDTAAHRRLLQQSGTHFAICSGQLLIFGNAAREWSAILNLPLSHLLRAGRIPSSDPISRQVLTFMIDALLPAPERPGMICKMTLPGSGHDDRFTHRDAQFFHQLVALRGYLPQFITSTQALALAELNEAGFTGFLISIGHVTCEFGLVHCGREIVRCVVKNGLQSFQGAPQLGGADIAHDKRSSSIEHEYVRFFTSVVGEAREQFERDGTLKTMPRTLPVVCSGQITAVPTFLPLFQQVWNDAKWLVSTRPIRAAADANLAIVRGCLIQAVLDQPSEREAA